MLWSSWIISMGQLTAVKSRYPLTNITWPYRGLRCRPIEVECFLEVIRWQVIWNMLCLCHYSPALLRFWFQTNLGRENSASYLEILAGKTFSCQGHTVDTLYVQFLCSDWSKFDRSVHADNLCIILNLVYFDGWSWQSFVSTCVVFNCLFLLDVQKWNTAAIKSILLFVASLFWFFGWEMRRLSKSQIWFRMASFSFFTLLEKSEAILTLLGTFQELHLEW